MFEKFFINLYLSVQFFLLHFSLVIQHIKPVSAS
nr:MAG TPA: hypothetical protein [Caudoviricetes sp.]